MKFLIDNSLSPYLSDFLNTQGHISSHVRDFQMQASPDEEIFELAVKEASVVVSADTDFGTLLALRKETKPSVILFRKNSPRVPTLQAQLLVANLPRLLEFLDQGSIVVFDEHRIRIRSLPISK